MNPQETIKQLLEKKDNDYSCYEPFENKSPIHSSIIIPVHNGKESLERTLKNLSKHKTLISNPNLFELIVVDDGSEEDIYSVFEKICFPCDNHLITHKRNLGRSVARNSGIKESKNKLLFFFDADVLLPSNYFERMWMIHNSVDRVVAVGLAQNKYLNEISSLSLDSEKITPDITDDFRYYKKFKDLQFGRREFRLINETEWFKHFGYHKRIGPWTLPKMIVTHNVSIRREYVLDIRGFDERFKTWGYEDTYFGAKLIANESYVIPSKQTGVIRILKRDKKKKFSDENRDLYERLIDYPLKIRE